MLNTSEIKIGDLLFDDNRVGWIVNISSNLAEDTLYLIEWADGMRTLEGTHYTSYFKKLAMQIKRKA